MLCMANEGGKLESVLPSLFCFRFPTFYLLLFFFFLHLWSLHAAVLQVRSFFTVFLYPMHFYMTLVTKQKKKTFLTPYFMKENFLFIYKEELCHLFAFCSLMQNRDWCISAYCSL